jgi:hypothetical protein
MAKDRTPPAPQAQYEGFPWLGSQWGRSGNAKPAKRSAWFAVIVTLILWYLAVRAYENGGLSTWVIGNALVGGVCALAAAFSFVEAHFAARAALEQKPSV